MPGASVRPVVGFGWFGFGWFGFGWFGFGWLVLVGLVLVGWFWLVGNSTVLRFTEYRLRNTQTYLGQKMVLTTGSTVMMRFDWIASSSRRSQTDSP
jgi:hypothetical protein